MKKESTGSCELDLSRLPRFRLDLLDMEDCWALSTSLHHLFQLRLPETQNTELIPANYMIYNSKLLDCCY